MGKDVTSNAKIKQVGFRKDRINRVERFFIMIWAPLTTQPLVLLRFNGEPISTHRSFATAQFNLPKVYVKSRKNETGRQYNMRTAALRREIG
jgi:hypothetical protein